MFILEGCRAGVRWRIVTDRSGRIIDKAERGPCFRKLLGVGMDDVQAVVHWMVGCEEPLDEAEFAARISLNSEPLVPKLGQAGSATSAAKVEQAVVHTAAGVTLP